MNTNRTNINANDPHTNIPTIVKKVVIIFLLYSKIQTVVVCDILLII